MASTVIGIEMGGSRIRAAEIKNGTIGEVVSGSISATEASDVILNELFGFIDQIMNDSVHSIGIGVPGVVDVESGIVYDVQNIPSWNEVHLKKYLEARYEVPAMVNNDANCFALGEKYFGKGKSFESFIGLKIGTGLGAGILIDGKLYSGHNCGAGEFGQIKHKDHYFEYYTSGQFFKNVHNTTGQAAFEKAQQGDKEALAIFKEFGENLGDVIQMILYSFDVESIILGGSINMAYEYFQEEMWKQINEFHFSESLKDFSVQVSSLSYSGILGAAALYFDEMFRNIKAK